MNTLSGIVAESSSADGVHLLQVDVAGSRCVALLLGDGVPAHPGQPVRLAFRELDVALALAPQAGLSIRNQLPCQVVAVAHGALLSRAALQFGDSTLHAVITRAAAQALALQAGQPVVALIKSHAMLVCAA